MQVYKTKRFLSFFLLVSIVIVSGFNVLKTSSTAKAGANSLINEPQNNTVYLPFVTKIYSSRTLFGIDMNNKDSTAIAKVVEANASWGRRYAVKWSTVEQVEGQYDWKYLEWLDNLSVQANENGFTLMPIVSQAPDWAQEWPGWYCGKIKADKIDAFAEFMYQLVLRYSYPPYNVMYWQIWNEPDVPRSWISDPQNPYGCWGDPNEANYYGGEYYADVLQAVYPRVKAANPSAQVVIGGLLMGCNPNLPSYQCGYHQAKYLEGILYNHGLLDGKNYFDIVAFHTYSDYDGELGHYVNGGWNALWNNVGPVVIEKARFVRDVLAQYGASSKPVIVSELALRCGPGETAPSCSSYVEDFELTKAYYVAQAYGASIAENLTAAIWFDLNGPWRNVALLNSDYSNRPAYTAFKVASSNLSNGVYVREITEYAGVKGYVFSVNGKEVWLLWSLDGNPHQINLPTAPSSSLGVLGNELGYSTTFTLTIEPIYLIFP